MEQIDCILQQSRGYEQVIDQTAVMMTFQEKFLPDIALEIAKIRIEQREMWNLETFMRLLYQLVEARESIEYTAPRRYRKPEEPRSLTGTRQRSLRKVTAYKVAEQSQQKSRQLCVFCKGDHYNSNCPIYKTVEERKRQAYELGLCIRCLRSGHRFKNCRIFRPCYYCKKDHNTALCERFIGPINPSGEGETKLLVMNKKENDTQMTTLEVENIVRKIQVKWYCQ